MTLRNFILCLPLATLTLSSCQNKFADQYICTDSFALPNYCEQVLVESRSIYGLLVDDINGDGHLDVYPHGHGGKIEKYYRGATNFSPAPYQFNHADRHGCDSADYDQDGRIDIFCSVGSTEGEGTGNNQLFRNTGDGMLALQDGHGAEDPFGRGREARFFNFNGDAYPDLFVANWGTRKDDKKNESAIYINEDGQRLKKSDAYGFSTLGANCLEFADWDGDTFDGTALCNSKKQSKIFLNQNGVFKDITESLGAVELKWWDVSSRDFNKDGKPDLTFISRNDVLNIFHNSGIAANPFSLEAQHIDLIKLIEPIGKVSKPPENFSRKFSLEFFDANLDGIQDIYLGTNLIFNSETNTYLGDFIIFGPDFKNHLWLGETSTGTGSIWAYNENSILVSRAGPDWKGPLFLLKPATQ